MRLIDADVLLTQMEELHKKRSEESYITGDRKACVTWDDAVVLIKDALTVNVPDRKVGKWIDLGKDRAIRWKCPECGRKDTHIYNYCPDCGSDNRR